MIVRTGGDEYDVPQYAENKEKVTRTCNHTITGSWMPVRKDGTLQNAYAALTPHGTKNGCESKGSGKCQVYLAALHGHCHAPTCLRLDTFNNDTGEFLGQEPGFLVDANSSGFFYKDVRNTCNGTAEHHPCALAPLTAHSC